MSCLRKTRGAIALLIILCGTCAKAVDLSNVLIVDLYINHERMGETFVLRNDAGDFFVSASSLEYWEILKPWPSPEIFDGQDYYRVNALSGATAELDNRTMELRIFLPSQLMPTRRMNLQADGVPASQNGLGAFMDYEINWLKTDSRGSAALRGLLRPVIFGPIGNLSANVLYQGATKAGGGGRLSVLDLTYTRDDPDRMRTIRAGDVFTTPGTNGRSVRMGGLQIATNFSTRPMLITYPLPEFYGQTDVPSALDIYVNGRLSRTQDVQPGAFVLEDIPVVNGAGQMQVVATDALGRQQVFTQDFYLSTELLSEGLSDYSITVGALREDYGQRNFRYGDVAASGTWRYGYSNNLTLEGHSEITSNVAMLGGSLRYGLQSGGTISAGLGVSNTKPGIGASWNVGYLMRTPSMNFNFDVYGSSERFDLIGNSNSEPKLQLLVAAGKNFHQFGSLRASLVQQEHFDRPKKTIWSLDYSKVLFDRLSMSSYISYLDAAKSDLSAGIRFFMSFGRNHSVNGSMSTSRFGNNSFATVRKNIPLHTGYGYHFTAASSDSSFVDAGIVAQNEIGIYSLDVRNDEFAGSSWQAGVRGSIATMAGMTRFSRQVNDAFAVVKVGELEGVRVYSENVEIGRTNSDGEVLIPGLRPYIGNRLRIEVDDLPLTARIGNSEIETAPFYKSGVIINFDVRDTTNVLLRAVLPDGNPVPEGSIATVFHTGDRSPVGMDGKLFLQGIDRSSEIQIRWAANSCDLEVPYPSSSAVIAKLGEIVCMPRAER